MPKSAPPRKAQSAAKQAARKAAMKPGSESPPMMIVDGVEYALVQEDLTTLDITALRRATGMGLRQLAEAAMQSPDIDVVAAWVWLSRRSQGEPGLPYEIVANDISYQTRVTFDNEAPAKGQGLPEA